MWSSWVCAPIIPARFFWPFPFRYRFFGPLFIIVFLDLLYCGTETEYAFLCYDETRYDNLHFIMPESTRIIFLEIYLIEN